MPDGGAQIRLVGDGTRRAACRLVMTVPNGWLCEIGEPRRTLRQSSKFWATCGEVAKSGTLWSGTTHDKESWHDLFLGGWNIVKHRAPRMLIGLENEVITLMRHSRRLTESEMSDLLDYTLAWCAMHQVSLREDDN